MALPKTRNQTMNPIESEPHGRLESVSAILSALERENRALRECGNLLHGALARACDLMTELRYVGTAAGCFEARKKWESLAR